MLMDSNPARALLNLLPAKESLKKINSSWSSLPSWGWFVSFFSLQKHQMEADNNDDYILRESPLPPILECQGYSFVQSFGFATKAQVALCVIDVVSYAMGDVELASLHLVIALRKWKDQIPSDFQHTLGGYTATQDTLKAWNISKINTCRKWAN